MIASAKVSAQNYTTASLPVKSLRIHGTFLRPRVLGRGNVILGGLMFTQEMRKDATQHTCTARFSHLSTHCVSLAKGAASESGSAHSPYGTDPAFNPLSEMFSSVAARNEETFYNTSDGSSEMTSEGFPAAFYARTLNNKPKFVVAFPVCTPSLMHHQNNISLHVHLAVLYAYYPCPFCTRFSCHRERHSQ